MPIHPTAVIDPGATLHESVEVGPYVVIEANVTIGANTKIYPFVHIMEGVEMGEENVVHSHAVLGDAPQHLAYDGSPRRVKIGNKNVLREYVTVNRPFESENMTTIGDGCFLMANSHVGHDSHLGDGVILTNNALIAGHCEISNNVILSGSAAVHQFVRVGRLAFVRGLSGATKDLPPFCIVREINRICGLNTVGMRRAGIEAQARKEIKDVYRILFREQHSVSRALEILESRDLGAEAREMIDFVKTSKRGICSYRGD